jgi:hypothetical protein
VSYFLSLVRGCLLAMLFAVAGCPSVRRAEARRWALCTCEYVTDMDYPGKLKLVACGEPSRRSDVAKSCALASGAGAVMTCTCEPEGELCRDSDICKEVPR